MSEEELKKLCKEEFLKNIKENIKSETIFTYVDGLEKENKKQKEVLDKIKEKLKVFGNKEDISANTMYYISGKSLIYILELLEEIK